MHALRWIEIQFPDLLELKISLISASHFSSYRPTNCEWHSTELKAHSAKAVPEI